MTGQSQPILTHLRELRRRVTYAAISVGVSTLVAFAFHEQILTVLAQPAQGFVEIPNGKPVYTDLTELIGIAAKASLLVGLFASLPLVLYQAIMFIAPGLTRRERRYLGDGFHNPYGQPVNGGRGVVRRHVGNCFTGDLHEPTGTVECK